MRVQVRLIDTFFKAGWLRTRELEPGTVLYAEDPGTVPLGGMVTCYTDKGKRLSVPRSLLEIVQSTEERAEKIARERRLATEKAEAIGRLGALAESPSERARREWAEFKPGAFSVMLTGFKDQGWRTPISLELFLTQVAGLRGRSHKQIGELVERAIHIAPEPIAADISQEDAVRLKMALEKEGGKAKIVERRLSVSAGGRPTIPAHVRREVWKRDEGRCVDCGSRDRLEYDHIIPLSKGGANTARNIELRCESCNRQKAASV